MCNSRAYQRWRLTEETRDTKREITGAVLDSLQIKLNLKYRSFLVGVTLPNNALIKSHVLLDNPADSPGGFMYDVGCPGWKRRAL